MTQLTLPMKTNDTSKLVLEALKDWRTIPEVRDFVYKKSGGKTHMTEGGMAARMRELRGVKFGSCVVKKQHIGNRLYEYRLGEA